MLSKIGKVGTDSGLLYISDPSGNEHNKLLYEKVRHIATGKNINRGFAIPTGGDGEFSIYKKTQDIGRLTDRTLKKIIFDFTDGEISNPRIGTHAIIVWSGLALLLLFLFRNRT